MDLKTIGKNIRKYRVMKNLRREALAEKADLSVNYVGAIERGEKIPAPHRGAFFLVSFITINYYLWVGGPTPCNRV